MKTRGTFIGWDFTTPIWYLNTGNYGYPHFDPVGGTYARANHLINYQSKVIQFQRAIVS